MTKRRPLRHAALRALFVLGVLVLVAPDGYG